MVLRVAFLHVGQDTILPRIMIRSIRQFNPDARVTQCSDRATPEVSGVDEVVRLDGDTGRLMTFRLRSFAGLPISEPTLFLDTDMVCVDRIDAVSELSEYDVSVCVREFNKDMLFDPRAMDIDLREYEGRTLDEVYPYLACAVIAKNSRILVFVPQQPHKPAGQISSMVWRPGSNAQRYSGRHLVDWQTEGIALRLFARLG